MAHPYEKAFIIQYDDGSVTLEKKIPTTIESQEDTIITLQPGQTLHDLAYEYYGDSGKWYVLAEANNIANPFEDLVEGMKIRIPTYGIIE